MLSMRWLAAADVISRGRTRDLASRSSASLSPPTGRRIAAAVLATRLPGTVPSKVDLSGKPRGGGKGDPRACVFHVCLKNHMAF
jgi:hypothetical protein